MQAENKAKIKVPKPYVELLEPREFQDFINVHEKSTTENYIKSV